ncbi:MAG: C2 family cysteine protease [Myxococcota bacterium]
MLSQTRAPGKKTGSPPPAVDATPPKDKQDRLGNAAVQTEADVATPTHRGPELKEPGAKQPLRPAKTTKGQRGALIGTGKEVTLYKSSTGNSRKTRVADGAEAEVLESKDGRLKVSVRSGKKNVEGWVDAAVFSDQPALTRDEDNKALTDDFVYSKVEGDHSPVDPTGKDTAQGAIGDCFFIASMAAVANASPQAIKDMVKYDKEKGTYTVRFYEEDNGGKYKPVYIEVDAYLPTEKKSRNDPSYAGDPGGKMWPAIIEKAYAKWKGGYDVIGEGGTGEQAMAEITGSRSKDKRPSSMKEAEVVPFFQQAKKDGKAIYAGVKDGMKSAVQTPFSGSKDGPFKGKVTQTHRWNEIIPGSLRITDKKGKADEAWDEGEEGDQKGTITGDTVKDGHVHYKGDDAHTMRLTYDPKKGPAAAADLQVEFDYEGVLDLDAFIIGNHAYAFEEVVNGKELQFYNPWGTYQPKPITPAKFLALFDSLTTNTPPAKKTQG